MTFKISQEETPEQSAVVGTNIAVIFLGFNDNTEIVGKVDTGAAQTSLGVENIVLSPDVADNDKQNVKFTFNDKTYTMPVAHMQSIQSSDSSVTYRPIVQFSIKFEQQIANDVSVNLHDRTGMPDQLLIGLNLLQEYDLLVDPTMTDESVEDVDAVTEIAQFAVEPTNTEEPEEKQEPEGFNADDEPVDAVSDPIEQILQIIRAHPEITIQQLMARSVSESLSTYINQ